MPSANAAPSQPARSAQKALVVVLLGALALRLIVYLVYRPWDPAVEANSAVALPGDSVAYHQLALCILEQSSFCNNAYRTPGYPAFIAMVYAAFGIRPWVVLLAQVVVSLATVLLTFKLGELVFSRRVGVVAAVLVAIDPGQVFFALDMLSDVLFACLFLGSVYFYLRGLMQHRLIDLAACGLLLGAAVLVRPIAQYYWAVLVVFALLWPLGPWATRLKGAAVVVAVLLAVIGPWMARNHALYDTARLSWLPGQNLLFWQVANARAENQGTSREVVSAQLKAVAAARGYSPAAEETIHATADDNPFLGEAIARTIALEHIRSDPVAFAQGYARGVLRLWTRVGATPMAEKLGLAPRQDGSSAAPAARRNVATTLLGLVALGLLVANYLLFVGGLFALRAWPHRMIAALFVVTMLYFSLATGVLGDVRFRLPFSPLFMLIGAVWASQLLSRLRWATAEVSESESAVYKSK
jgi:4-amino-4-deoxy-L-arabinose transferase-like glycosyltransferase